MKSKRLTVVGLCLCLALGSVAMAQQSQDCELCQAMSHVNKLMKQVKVETKIIDNGLITVTVVPDDMQGKLAAAHKDVHAVVKKFKAGSAVKLGEACTAMFAKPRLQRAKVQAYQTDSAYVTLITSDEPALVNEIHQLGAARGGQAARIAPGAADVQSLVGSSRMVSDSNCYWNGTCLVCDKASYGCGHWGY